MYNGCIMYRDIKCTRVFSVQDCIVYRSVLCTGVYNVQGCMDQYKTSKTEINPLTMHKLKVLVNYSLEKSPMSSEETRVLPDHVHNVASYNSFIIFASLLLTKS